MNMQRTCHLLKIISIIVIKFIKLIVILQLVVCYRRGNSIVFNGNGNENISNAPPTVDRRRIT